MQVSTNNPIGPQTMAESYQTAIQDAVGENQLADALNRLQDFVSNLAPELKNNVLLLRRRYSQFRDEDLNRLANPADADAIGKTILDLAAAAQQKSAVRPRYATLPSPPSARTPPHLQLVSSVPNSHSPLATMVNPNVDFAAQEVRTELTEDIDEQLRRFWASYRSRQPAENITAVDCQNVGKVFHGNKFNLDQLSFSMRIGQITGVVGRNASGKTTLLRLVLGEIAPDRGTVSYPALTRDGADFPSLKRQMAYIPQSFAPGRSVGRVKTTLLFSAAAHGTSGTRGVELVDWYVQRYGLSDYENSKISTLSGGFRMRYELVNVLISRPRLLVLDEPLASLDVLARQEFLRNLRAIAYSLEEPVPILVTSQHLYEIEAVADQMIVLDEGKCLFIGSLRELDEDYHRTRLYEVNTYLSKRLAQERLSAVGMTIREVISDGFIVGTSTAASSHEGIGALVALFGDDLYGIRDITASSRRFFVEPPRPGGI